VANGFEVIRPSSLVDEAYRQIRAQILAGSFRPGAPLKDSMLAEQMGTSRSPVREALRLLEQSGLVEKSANRSYRLATFDAGEVPELALLRASDELLAITRIVEQRSPLDTVQRQLDRVLALSDDVAEQAAADAAFHLAVVELAGLPRLAARYADLTDQIRLVLLAHGLEHGPDPESIAREHVKLLGLLRAAIESGTTDELTREWEAHVYAGLGVPVPQRR
jgi:DNA-binding GntR family transcriptional regulator